MKTALLFAGQGAQAVGMGKDLAEAYPTARALFDRANAAYQQGDARQAIRLYRKFLTAEPGSVGARANLGAALAHDGRYADAIVQYQEVLRLDPGNSGVTLNLALARYKQADFEKAAEDFARVRRSLPQNRQSLYLLADCFLRLGRNRDAISLLQPVYDGGPPDRAVECTVRPRV